MPSTTMPGTSEAYEESASSNESQEDADREARRAGRHHEPRPEPSVQRAGTRTS